MRSDHTLKNRFEGKAGFEQKTFVVQADLCSPLVPNYLKLYHRFPYADGLRDVSICDVQLPPDVQGLTEALLRGEITYACIGWLLYSMPFSYAAHTLGKSPREYADELYGLCRKVNTEIGYRGAWIEAFGEVAAGIVWPGDRALTKTQALAYFRDWFTSGKPAGYSWGQNVAAGVRGFYTDAKARSSDLRALPIYYTDACMYMLTEAFRFGFPLVCFESQCATMESLQTGIAFIRGGAKMYDAWWGVDFSPCENGLLGKNDAVEVDSVGNWRHGITADHQFRAWITAYMSGCNTILHEASYRTFYAQPTEEMIIPSDTGHLAMKFYALTRNRLADRGRPVVPFAIMLEEAHGYGAECLRSYRNDQSIEITSSDVADRTLYVWHGKIEPTGGDWALSHLIHKTLWPVPEGAWRDLGAGEWPRRCKKDFDWAKAPTLEELNVQEQDPRNCSRFSGDSRWADCFDFVTEAAGVEKLSKYYKVVILAGAVQTNKQSWATLLEFMNRGGSVVCSIDQLDPEARRCLELDVSEQPLEMVCDGEVVAVYPVRSGNFTLISVDAAGHPVVIEKKVGLGKIDVMLFTNGMTATGDRISKQFEKLIDGLYSEWVGIHRNGLPCQMLVNQGSEETLVSLINHTVKDWRGSIRVDRKNKPGIEQVRDLMADEAFPGHLVEMDKETITVRVRVPAGGVRILSFGKTKSRRPERQFNQPNLRNLEEKKIEQFKSQNADHILGAASD